MPEYAALLERVAEEQRRFGSDAQSRCTLDQIQRLVEYANQMLHAQLPAEYLDFLRLTNGLDWNGVVVYASDAVPIVGHPDRTIASVVEMNVISREAGGVENSIVLGSDGMDVYTYSIAGGIYEQYDPVPHELIETFATFDGMMTSLLRRCLQS